MNTFRVSHDLKAEYSKGLATASRILSSHQRLVHDAHLIVFDGRPEQVDVYRQIEDELLQYFDEAQRDQGGDPIFAGLLNSMKSENHQLRNEEHQALDALAHGDAPGAQQLLHRQANRSLAWSLEAKVAEYIEALDRVFSDRLDAEVNKELVSLFAAFGVFGLSVAIWILLIQRLRTCGRALEDEMAQRRAAEEQLRRSQKMEALGQLAAGVSHDFNNILSVIQGFVDVARSRSTDGSCADEALQKIQVAARQGTDLTRSLLSFSGRAGTEMEPVDIGRLVADTVRLLRETMPASVQIRIDSTVPGAGGWVWGNKAQLQQVLVNLVLNVTGSRVGVGRPSPNSAGGCPTTDAWSASGVPGEKRPRPYVSTALRKATGFGGTSATMSGSSIRTLAHPRATRTASATIPPTRNFPSAIRRKKSRSIRASSSTTPLYPAGGHGCWREQVGAAASTTSSTGITRARLLAPARARVTTPNRHVSAHRRSWQSQLGTGGLSSASPSRRGRGISTLAPTRT